MYKKLVAAIVGALAVTVSATSVSAGVQPQRMIGASPSELDAGGSFTVTYSNCIGNELIEFVFDGVAKTATCDGDVGVPTLQQGIRALPAGDIPVDFGPGSASQTFTAPDEAGPHDGIGYVKEPASVENGRDALDVQAPVEPQGFRGGGLVAQVPSVCTDNLPNCLTFTVTVRPQQVTTTTVAPTPTQAPTTTVAGVAGGGATNTLPATGAGDSDNTATIAIVLLVAGFALIVATRWRGAADRG